MNLVLRVAVAIGNDLVPNLNVQSRPLLLSPRIISDSDKYPEQGINRKCVLERQVISIVSQKYFESQRLHSST